jgi:outer membrane protein assembly factor BamA
MPLVKFAITQQLSVGGGVRITELDPLLEPLLDPLAELQDSRMANAGIGFVNYSQRSRPGSGPRHDVEAAVTVRAGTEALSSDLVYERYVGQADYSFRRGKHEVRVSGMAGRIDGDAPLFERFSLGDSRTLRGWDKWDIAPAGGDRMFHTTVEYRYQGLGMFLDTGSVWDARGERRVRVSTGVTFNPGPVFFTLGFPVNTDEFRAVFTMGFRFSGASVGIKKY